MQQISFYFTYKIKMDFLIFKDGHRKENPNKGRYQ